MGIDIYPNNILEIIKEIMQWDSKSFFISFQDCGGYITPETPVISSDSTIEECMSNCGVIYPDISDISAENIEYAYECLKKCDITLDKTLEFIDCMKSCRADGFDIGECSPRCRTDIGEKKSYQSCKSLCNSVECIYNCGMKQISDSAIFKCIENCKNDYSEYETGYNQCIIGCTGLGDRDTDNDGVPDYLEEEGCLTTPDCDGDGIVDSIDPNDHSAIPVTSAQLLCKDECESIADISEKNQCIINCYPDFIVKQRLYSCVTHCDQEYSDIYSKTDCIDHGFYISETEKSTSSVEIAAGTNPV